VDEALLFLAQQLPGVDPTRATEAITRGGADGTNYTLLVVLILAVSVVAVLWRREVNAGTAREERIKALEAEVKTAQTATAAAQTDKAEAIGRLTTDHATAQGALYAAHATALREQHEAYSTQLNELRAELSAAERRHAAKLEEHNREARDREQHVRDEARDREQHIRDQAEARYDTAVGRVAGALEAHTVALDANRGILEAAVSAVSARP
jgi:hypothetical protein